MKISKKYSHLNGEEWLLVHEPELHQEIFATIAAVDAEKCRTKLSQEMSSGIAFYEGELHNILRHGRSHPPVPLVIFGVEP